MTQTNTDFLFQITPAATDRSYGAGGSNDGAGKFNDHLSQAATYSGDDSYHRSSSSQRTESSQSERDPSSWNSSSSKSSNHDSDRSDSSPVPSDNRSDSNSEVSAAKAPADDADRDEHDTDQADEVTAAEAACAVPASSPDPKKAQSKTDDDAAQTVKAAAISKKAAAEAVKTGTDANAQSTKGFAPTELAAEHAEQATQLAPSEADIDETSEREESHVAADGKKSKGAKAGKSEKGVNVVGDGECTDSSSPKSEPASTSSEAVNQASDAADASAAGALSIKSKDESDADKTADDESRSSGQSDTRTSVRNDTAPAVSKVDTAQLVGAAPVPADAAASASPNRKDDESSTKPITAKGEPVATAFARMTRNNVGGSSDTNTDANSGPQVDPARFIGRVAKAFQTAQDRGGKLQLRLSPPELGALRIELNVKDGVMSASLQTENANARRLLLDHLPALRDRLAEQNIRVDRFDVDVRQESTGGHADTRGSQQQQFQKQSDQPTPRRVVQTQMRAQEVAAPERTVVPTSVSDAGLNLVV